MLPVLKDFKQSLLRERPRPLGNESLSWQERNALFMVLRLCTVVHALLSSSSDSDRRPVCDLHWSNGYRFASLSRHWHALAVPGQTSSLLVHHLAGRNGRGPSRACASKHEDEGSLPISSSSAGRPSPLRRW